MMSDNFLFRPIRANYFEISIHFYSVTLQEKDTFKLGSSLVAKTFNCHPVTPQVYQGLPLLPFSAVLLEDVGLLLELPSHSSRCGQSS